MASNGIKHSKLNNNELGIDPISFNDQDIFVSDRCNIPYVLKLMIRIMESWEIPEEDVKGYNYICGYDLKDQNLAVGREPGESIQHCIAVWEIIDSSINGFNSWGTNDPRPQIKLDRRDLIVYEILVKEVTVQDVLIEKE